MANVSMQETLVRFLSSGRSPGKGIGYPLQYSWASGVAQLVKNLPAMQRTPVLIPGWGRSPGKGIGYPLQYSWTSLVDEGHWGEKEPKLLAWALLETENWRDRGIGRLLPGTLGNFPRCL